MDHSSNETKNNQTAFFNAIVDNAKKMVGWLWNTLKNSVASKLEDKIANKIITPEVIALTKQDNIEGEYSGSNLQYWKINELSNGTDLEVRQKILASRKRYGEKNHSKYLKMNFYNVITSLEDIQKNLMNTYKKESNAFKLHVSFGYVTEKFTNDTSDIILYAPGHQYFNDEPNIINNSMDMKQLVSTIDRETIVRKLALSFPDTSTRLIGVYSMAVKVIRLDFPIGAKIKLPDYIKKSNSVIGLENVDNNICFWACMALAEGCRKDRYIARAKELFNDFYKNKKSIKDYDGFDYINELDKYEKFNTKFAINIISYNEDKSIEYVRKSDFNSDRQAIYLNLYLNHLSYIPNLDKLAKMYICNRCSRPCRDNTDLRKHIDICNLKQQDKFVQYPKVYEKKRNVIVELTDYFNIDCDFKHDYLITFDLESMLQKINESKSKLTFVQKHIPLSVSIASNVPGFEEVHFILSTNPDDIAVLMFEYFDKISVTSNKIMMNKMSLLINKVSNHYNEREKRSWLNIIENYCSNIPIVGFNSGFYDINLLSNHGFMREIIKRDNNPHVIKNGTRYKVIKTNQFTFLDQMNYCAAGTDLRSFIKAHDIDQDKGHFPYEFLDSYEKLDCLISDLNISDFDSSLKNSKMREDDFKQLMQTCQQLNLVYIKDLLKWYNNLDVGPLLKACLKNKEFYYNFKLDMYKDAYTLPGLAENILFQSAQDGFDDYLKQEPTFSYNFIPNNIERKIENYKSQDIEAERSLDNFIEKHEVIQQFRKQTSVCHYCWTDLKNHNWSLDRIDCSRAHVSGNCVIACIKCNIQRKDTIITKFYRMKALTRFAKTKPMIHLIDESNKEVFYKLKNNIVGGPSIVYHRYHEAGKTRINRVHYNQNSKRWYYNTQVSSIFHCLRSIFMQNNDGKDVKKIVGFDANALYLHCLGQDQLCGILKWIPTSTNCDGMSGIQRQMLQLTSTSQWITFLNEFFGLVEIDIEIPEDKYEYFGEMPPLFKNVEYSEEESGNYMRNIISSVKPKFSKNRKLIASLKATKILINSTRLKWLLEKGAIVTKLYGVISADRGKPFENFVNWVSDERRKGDKDTCYAIIAEAAKLVGNSAYGRTGMNKNKYKSSRFCNETQFNRAKNNYFFYDANVYDGIDDEKIYEVVSRSKTVKQNMPIQVAFNVLDHAKLRMSEFYYDCVDKYIDRNDYQYMYMDTDSAYMAVTDDFENLIKPGMREEFEKDKHNWFPRDDHNKAYDRRKPGLFKLEWSGDGMIALSSKTYYCWGASDKFSSKGTQRTRNKQLLNKEAYQRCLEDKEIVYGQNKGFRFIINNMKTYEQNKIALTPIYDKGIVMDDGVHIRPLNI